jgi:DNA-binding XRE family transcriptional regulator
MPRIFVKSNYTPEEREELKRIRAMSFTPEGRRELSKTTGERIHSASYNAIGKLIAGLRDRREELGLNQADVAKRMGIEVSSLCRLETFKVNNPTIWTLCQWAEALDCTIDLGIKAVRKSTKSPRRPAKATAG